MKGFISARRRAPDTFLIQGQSILSKDLGTRYMKTETRKRFKTWRYFPRFLPIFTAHKDQISYEEDLAKFMYEHYGVGVFNVLFRGSVMYIPKSKRTKIKKHPKYRPSYVWQKRARIEIYDSPDIILGEPFSYKFIKDDNKMHMMPFWKGQKNKVIKDDNTVNIDNTEKVNIDGFSKLEKV